MVTGERRSNLKDSDDQKVIPGSSGRLPKEDTKGIVPDLGEEATPDHTEMIVDLEAEAEASPLHRRMETPTLELEPEIEKSRQKDQRATWSRKWKVWRRKLVVLRKVLEA